MAQPTARSTTHRALLAEIARDVRQGRLIPGVTTGLLIGLLTVINTVSFTALFFAGELSAFLSAGITLTLAGTTVMCLVGLLTSSERSSIVVTQDAPNAVLASLVAPTLAALPAASAQQKFSTVVLLIIGTTLLTGLVFILVGRFRLGALVRFLPYPVVGGFIASTGWPLISGSLSLMSGGPLRLTLLTPAQLPHWVPGLLFGCAVVWATRRYRHPLTIPLMIAAATLLFYTVAWLSGLSLAALAGEGWLFAFAPGGQWRPPLAPAALSLVDWPALLAMLPNILPIALIGVLVLLLNVTGIELVVERDIDLNRELVVAGASNMAASLAGGAVGFHSLSRSGLNHTLSGGSPVSGLVAVAFCGLATLAGPLALAYLPRLVLGGLLAYIGLATLVEWTVGARRRFPPLEFAIILVITLVSAAFGYLAGMAAGLVAAVLLFVISYSRINVVRHALSGLTYRSRVMRGSSQRAALLEHGEQIQIMQLQGFLFFGTANSLIEQVRARLGPAQPPFRLLILDFHHVTGLDSTALLFFSKLQLLARDHGITLVITSLSGEARRRFAESHLLDPQHGVRTFDDLDHGLEWCEGEVLAAAGATEQQAGLEEQLAGLLVRPEQIAELLAHLERHEVAPGDYLIRQGDAPDDLYFVERGQVTAELEKPGLPAARLETMQGGRVVGEIGFYLGAPRTAAVRADEPATVYRLSTQQLAALEERDPMVASTLHRVVVRLLAERVAHLIRAVDALLR